MQTRLNNGKSCLTFITLIQNFVVENVDVGLPVADEMRVEGLHLPAYPTDISVKDPPIGQWMRDGYDFFLEKKKSCTCRAFPPFFSSLSSESSLL